MAGIKSISANKHSSLKKDKNIINENDVYSLFNDGEKKFYNYVTRPRKEVQYVYGRKKKLYQIN